MPNPTSFPGDVFIGGNLTPVSLTPPNNSIGDAAIPVGAGIAYTKTEKLNQPIHSQGQGVAANAETKVMKVVWGATGSVLGFKAAAHVACIGADTVSVDLKKNGASILTAPISLTNAIGADVFVAGAVATPGLVVGDVLTVVITPNHSSGTLASGVYAALNEREDAQ